MNFRAAALAASILIPSVAFATEQPERDSLDTPFLLKPVVMRSATFFETPIQKSPIPPLYNVLKNLGLNISEADYQVLSKGGSIGSDQFADYHNYRLLSGAALGDDVDFVGLVQIYKNAQQRGDLPQDIAVVNSAELFREMRKVGMINNANVDDFGQAIQHPDIRPPLDSHQDDILAAANLPQSFGLSSFLMSRLYDYEVQQGKVTAQAVPDYVVATSLQQTGVIVPGGYVLSTADNITEEHQSVSVFSLQGRKLGTAHVEMCAPVQYVGYRRQCLLKADSSLPNPVQIRHSPTFRFKNDLPGSGIFVQDTGAPFITNDGYLAGIVTSYRSQIATTISPSSDTSDYAFVEEIAPEILARISSDYPSPSQPKLENTDLPGSIYTVRYYRPVNVVTQQVIQIK